jgi:hypothetical protein
LKKKALDMRKERRVVAIQLKTAQKKQRRLKEKARQLTDEDLLSVILMRRGNKQLTIDPNPPDVSRPNEVEGQPAPAASSAASAIDGDVDLQRMTARGGNVEP